MVSVDESRVKGGVAVNLLKALRDSGVVIPQQDDATVL
jgi:hypothetical protein